MASSGYQSSPPDSPTSPTSPTSPPSPASPTTLSRSSARRLSRSDLERRRSSQLSRKASATSEYYSYPSSSVGSPSSSIVVLPATTTTTIAAEPAPMEQSSSSSGHLQPRPRRSSASIRRLSTPPEKLHAMSRDLQAALSGGNPLPEGSPLGPPPASSALSRLNSRSSLRRLKTAQEEGSYGEAFPSTPQYASYNSPRTLAPPSGSGLDRQPSITSYTLYLCLDGRIKRTEIDYPPNISSITMAFVERFGTNAVPVDFPPILIKSPEADIFYELDDLSLIKDHSILKLGDSQSQGTSNEIMVQEALGKVTTDISHLKALVQQFISAQGSHPLAANAHVGDQHGTPVLQPPPTPKKSALRDFNAAHPLTPRSGGPARANSLIASDDRSATDVATLRRQNQDLRSDLANEKRLREDAKEEAAKRISALEEKQGELEAALEASRIPPDTEGTAGDGPGPRAMISPGMKEMDRRTEAIARTLEDVQEMVADLKRDVTARGARPSSLRLRMVREQMEKADRELRHIDAFVDEVRPRWKAAWEAELQDVMRERDFLTEQQELLADLDDDRRALELVFGQLEKLVELQGRSSGSGGRDSRSLNLNVVGPEEGFLALGNVMEEISCVVIDSERRLRAMEMNEKARKWELENTKGEFEQELESFVGEGRLRSTGGAEEAEKRREARAKKALLAMMQS